VCDHVGVIKAGQLVADETIESIRGKSIHNVEVMFANPFKASSHHLPNTVFQQLSPTHIKAEVHGDLNPLLGLIAATKVKDIEISHASLEEVFMRYYDA
jgi:ABC-2 type transport system ATP-binding protein